MNPTTRKVIYDLGANNGDDIPYYLKKADVVVAVEANPVLATQITQRFSREIDEKRLFVENCVLAARRSPENVNFYIHKSKHPLSQFPRPSDSEIAQFDEVVLPAKSVLDVISTHGAPYYIKIDIEGYDEVILGELFAADIRPPFISAESHSIGVFSLLVSAGRYRSFNLVNGPTVATKYKNHSIRSAGGEEIYSFPHHSAGPFGEDIRERWMTPNHFFKLLAFEQLGWKDVHATSSIEPDPSYEPYLEDYARALVKSRFISVLLRPYVKAFAAFRRPLAAGLRASQEASQ